MGENQRPAQPALRLDFDVGFGPHFLIEVGLVKEIKPEHISPQAFFGIGAQG
jgi:hypothetical protein